MFCSILIILRLLSTSFEYWEETTQEDFKDGIFEHNIYASHRYGGTIEFVPRFDLNNDGYIDVFVNQYGIENTYIYWGNSNGYSINRRTTYQVSGSGGNCDAADLNNDDYADFIVSKYYSPKLWIFWGSSNGPNPNSQTSLILKDGSNEACLIADFNKDGYLDIAIGNDSVCRAAVIWGSPSGYSMNNSTRLPVTHFTGHNLETADFNKDNWLDLLIVNRDSSANIIYWGSKSGFSASNRTEISFLSQHPHGASVADLNDDGWLDLVFTGNYQIEHVYIYWGSSTGFSDYQVLNIDGGSFGGSSIADLNNDGYLDILMIKGDSELKPFIYWGSAGGYSDDNRTKINNRVWGSGGFIADFNYDSYLDIYLNNFENNAGSYLFWGPNYDNHLIIPCESRDHHAMFREAGNTYNRQYFEEYQSSIFDAGQIADWQNIFWEDSLSCGNEIKMFLRSGCTPTPDSTWLSWIEVINGEQIPHTLNARYLQYMVKFIYTNPSNLPMLYSVLVGTPPPIARIDNRTICNPEISDKYKVNKNTLCCNEAGKVFVRIYDITGKMIGNLTNVNQLPVFERIIKDGRDNARRELPVGVYFYHIKVPGEYNEIRKIVIIR